MNRLEQQLTAELQKESPDEYLVEKLSKVIENGAITFKEWIDFTKTSTKQDFLNENPDALLREDCVNVITYLGGYYIQEIDTDLEPFYINDNIPLIGSIHIANQELWDLCSEELWIKDN